MKIKLCVVALVAFCFLVSGCSILFGNGYKVQYSQYLGGYWGPWKTFTYNNWRYYGTPSSFVVYSSDHPKNFSFRLTVDNYRGDLISKGIERRCSGTVEYKTDMTYDSSRWFVENELPMLSWGGTTYKRPATIVIEKKRGLYYYSVFFDNVGFAITIPWKD